MRLSIFAAIRVTRHQFTIVELHRWPEAAPLVATACLRIEHDAIVREIEFEPIVGFGADDRSHSQWRFEIANRKRQQQSLVLQPQQRHVHLAVIAEIADGVERLRTVG